MRAVFTRDQSYSHDHAAHTAPAHGFQLPQHLNLFPAAFPRFTVRRVGTSPQSHTLKHPPRGALPLNLPPPGPPIGRPCPAVGRSATPRSCSRAASAANQNVEDITINQGPLFNPKYGICDPYINYIRAAEPPNLRVHPVGGTRVRYPKP